MALRVVQWTTGNVGKRSVRAIVAQPDLELVGCYAWSPDKIGRDVGELCDIDAVGVRATDDVEALLALRPDCVVYKPLSPNLDALLRMRSASTSTRSSARLSSRTPPRTSTSAPGRSPPVASPASWPGGKAVSAGGPSSS